MKPDFKERVSRLRNTFIREGLDGVFMNSPNDIYYYTGKAVSKGSPGFLLVTKRRDILFVSRLDNRLEGPGVRIFDKLNEVKNELKPVRKTGFDEKNLSVLIFNKLRTGSWKPFTYKLKYLRTVKDEYEISQIRNATKSALGIVSSIELRGKTESGVSTEIQRKILLSGDSVAFDPIIASGANSSNIHHVPTKSRISKGLVIVDIGVRHNRYNSDITRTFSFNPTHGQERFMEGCKSMQKELICMAVPGTRFSDMQKEYERLMKAMGHKVMHGFGHGIGMSVHERPSGKDILEKGMVLTVEPGIYKKGIGGCRIEDMVLVSDKPVIISG